MEVTSFEPIANADAAIMVLGSMPGVRSLREQQYYAHPQNSFWRLMGQICGFDVHASYEERTQSLTDSGITIWDVLQHCEREGSLDADIQSDTEIPNDFLGFLEAHLNITHIFFNGQKAAKSFRKLVWPDLKPELQDRITLITLPSTSPANTSKNVEDKLVEWRKEIFAALVLEKKDRQRGLEQKSGGSSPKYGPAFYDEPAVFARYQAKRVGSSNANETLEKPIFDELAGDLQNLRILDLGCGDARFGLEALECGCRSYLGIEGSSNMFQLSQKNLAGTQGKVVYAAMEAWAYPESQFDLVVSCLALHYIEDITAMFAKIFKTLAPGGRLIFSVEHPVITSSSRSRPAGELRQDWTVDDFFWTGRRVTSWMGGKVIKFHRTVEDYFLALQDAGFQVDALRESRPKREIFEKFEDEVTYRRRMRIPLMLFFAARKPDADAFC